MDLDSKIFVSLDVAQDSLEDVISFVIKYPVTRETDTVDSTVVVSELLDEVEYNIGFALLPVPTGSGRVTKIIVEKSNVGSSSVSCVLESIAN